MNKIIYSARPLLLSILISLFLFGPVLGLKNGIYIDIFQTHNVAKEFQGVIFATIYLSLVSILLLGGNPESGAPLQGQGEIWEYFLITFFVVLLVTYFVTAQLKKFKHGPKRAEIQNLE